jgi:hypothetical protein
MGFLTIILKMGFIKNWIKKSTEELESINRTIDEMKELLASIDEKLERR